MLPKHGGRGGTGVGGDATSCNNSMVVLVQDDLTGPNDSLEEGLPLLDKIIFGEQWRYLQASSTYRLLMPKVTKLLVE